MERLPDGTERPIGYTPAVEAPVLTHPAIVEPPVSESAPLVSVILPVYNELNCVVQEIDRVHGGLRDSGLSYEVIVVDDGSSDGSWEAVRDRTDVRPIRHRRNLGSGAARKTGTLAARGEIVVWTDTDLTYPNDKIADLINDMGTADQIVGARTSEQGTMRLLRTPAKWFVRNLASYLSETTIPDLNSGFRAFRRSVALQYLNLLPRGFSCVSTITLAFLCNGYDVMYVPIEYRPRAGSSKFHPIRDAYLYLLQVLRMITYFNPIRVFLPVSVALATIGFAKIIADIVRYDFHIAGSTLMIVLTAIQIFAIGLVADLIVRRVR